uniref:Uncharacterized protein n=1 Tax=Myoviridae sp. ctNYa18 TaxID=2825090 RepID=A0A8S5PH26_9CAUD|nr:MAG TPA: hypothetical protein [Myoviridae sp. ctNYa18]
MFRFFSNSKLLRCRRLAWFLMLNCRQLIV